MCYQPVVVEILEQGCFPLDNFSVGSNVTGRWHHVGQGREVGTSANLLDDILIFQASADAQDINRLAFLEQLQHAFVNALVRIFIRRMLRENGLKGNQRRFFLIL